MRRLFTIIACVMCFTLSASLIDFAPTKKSEFYVVGTLLAKGIKPPVKGSHNTNIRKSTKDKHEKADARRQKEQEKAEQKNKKK